MKSKTFERHWNLLSFSRIGRRERNEDQLECSVEWTDEQTPIAVCIACDGVGGVSGGAECATAVIRATHHRLQDLLTIHGPSLLRKSHRELLEEALRQCDIGWCVPGATTMVALMFCGHRFWNGYHCAVAWAGDSRAHLIDKQGNYLLLTQDHHDEVGNLTSAYATPDGRCRGDLDVRNFVFAHRPLALGVTTDGVHGKCTEEELRCFLSWSLLQRDMESKSFGDAAENFLENNLSDNLSAVFVMRRIGLPEKILRGALEQWRDTHARTGN